jgi:hypothetical protein
MKLFANALLNAFSPLRDRDPFHFHTGESGRPYLCENPHCSARGYGRPRD